MSELNADSGQAQVQRWINSSGVHISLTGSPLCTPLTIEMINQVVKPFMFVVDWGKSALFISLQNIIQLIKNKYINGTKYTVTSQNDKTFPTIVPD